jgi:hypothetical protein
LSLSTNSPHPRFFSFVMDFFKIGSHKLFAWAGFNLDPPDLCLLSS